MIPLRWYTRMPMLDSNSKEFSFARHVHIQRVEPILNLMTRIPITRSKHLLPFAALLRNQGEPVGRLLRTTGLPVACLDDPEMLIPVSATTRFRELAAKRVGSANIALMATAHLKIADLKDFGQVLLRAPTLRKLLSEFCRLSATQTSNLALELHPQPGGDLWFSHRVTSEYGKGEWHRSLYTLSWMLKAVKLADPAWSPSEIWTDAPAAPQRGEAIETLGATPRFGQRCTGFLIPASLLASPLTTEPAGQPSRGIAEDRLWSTAPSKSYTESVHQLIRSYAGDRWLSVVQVSEVAGTSVRTLQRRLLAEQATYSSIVERTRAEMAGEMLESSDVSVAEIARKLGYLHQGDFTRAFHRWAEVSPTEYRQQRRRAATGHE